MGGEMTDLAAIRARVAEVEALLAEARHRAMEYAHGGHTIAASLVSRLLLALQDSIAGNAALCTEVERLRAEVAALKDGGGK